MESSNHGVFVTWNLVFITVVYLRKHTAFIWLINEKQTVKHSIQIQGPCRLYITAWQRHLQKQPLSQIKRRSSMPVYRNQNINDSNNFTFSVNSQKITLIWYLISTH